MTLGVFVTSTVAWFDISNNLIVNNLELGFSDDKGVQVSFSADGKKYSLADPTVLEKEVGYESSKPLIPVTSAYQSDWLNDKAVFGETMPVLHLGPVDGNSVTKSGYLQFPVYFTSAQDGYIYLDSATILKANDEENAKSAKKFHLSESDLKNIEKCARVSFYSQDFGFQIFEPNVNTPSKTLFGGRLDINPFDGFYDYNASAKREIMYGEYNSDSAILYYGLASTENTGYDGTLTCFNSGTKAGISPLDLEKSIQDGGLKIVQENAHSLSEMVPPEDGQSVGLPITYCYAGEPKEIILTIYVEGWDFDTVAAVIQSSFNFDLVFNAVYMPKISK